MNSVLPTTSPFAVHRRLGWQTDPSLPQHYRQEAVGRYGTSCIIHGTLDVGSQGDKETDGVSTNQAGAPLIGQNLRAPNPI